MALLNYEFDRQLELERADAYAEGFLRGYKKGFEKEMRKQMVFNMYEEGYSVDLIADIVVELTKEEIEDAKSENDLTTKRNLMQILQQLERKRDKQIKTTQVTRGDLNQ